MVLAFGGVVVGACVVVVGGTKAVWVPLSFEPNAENATIAITATRIPTTPAATHVASLRFLPPPDDP
ncbi:hypothetical protein QM646_49270, partial [Rhodococcus erythropolis]|nr:hypothetical protein [Rhodococcus erythropolis]